MMQGAENRIERGGRQQGIAQRTEQLRKILEVTGSAGQEKEQFIKEFINAEFRDLGWFNDTADLNKINDVELLMATGYDLRFIKNHHIVRELLEANIELQKQKQVDTADDSALTTMDIYQAIKDGADGVGDGIRLNKVDRNGNLIGEQIDLYEYVHLKKIKDFYALLDPRDREFSLAEIEKMYEAGEPIPVNIKKRRKGKDGKEIDIGAITQISDLRVFVQKPRISAEEFEYYYKTIEKSQTSMQYLSTLRDPSILGHHAENGGHAQMDKGLGGDLLYLPVSGRMAANYVRADVAKTPSRHRAAGHVHEIGEYEENTGICVAFEAEALRIWRNDVTDYQVHQSSFPRTLQNLMALNSREEPMTDQEAKTMWFGRKSVDGKDKFGKVYDAFHYHYDALMEERRGYKITDSEIGDKIFTDIIAVHFASNRLDWLMTFGKVSGFYTPQSIISGDTAMREDAEGRPKLVFFARRPTGGNKDAPLKITKETEFPDTKANRPAEYGEIHIEGFTAFAKYVQWRIRLRDVPGITDPKLIKEDFVKDLVTNKTKGPRNNKEVLNNQSVMDAAEEVAVDETIEDLTANTPNMVEVLAQIYGAEAIRIPELLASDIQLIKRIEGTNEVLIHDDIELRQDIKKKLDEDQNLLNLVNEITGEKASPMAAKRLVEYLGWIVAGRGGISREDFVKRLSKKIKP